MLGSYFIAHSFAECGREHTPEINSVTLANPKSMFMSNLRNITRKASQKERNIVEMDLNELSVVYWSNIIGERREREREG